LNKRLLKALIADQTAGEEVTFDGVERAPISKLPPAYPAVT
jgi:hypothetical protein